MCLSMNSFGKKEKQLWFFTYFFFEFSFGNYFKKSASFKGEVSTFAKLSFVVFS